MKSAKCQNVNLRPMSEADIPRAVLLTQAEGWPHSEQDWAFHLGLGHGWVLEGDGDELVGTLLYWKFGPAVATLGLIVVDPECQGRGLGKRLMERALEDISGYALRLVATAAGYRLYEGCGFQPAGPIEQRQGEIGNVVGLPLGRGEVTRTLPPHEVPLLLSLDRIAFGADRGPLLRAIHEQGETLALERNGKLVALACLRCAGRGHVVGPLIAQCAPDARLLLSHLLSGRRGFYRIDVPCNTGVLGSWLDQAGLPAVERVTAMHRAEHAPAERAQFTRFALVSQALG